MGVFQKNGAWWIDYYTDTGRRRRERIGGPLSKAMKKVAESVLHKRKTELAENKYLDKREIPRCTFSELADLYIPWAQVNHRGYKTTRSRVEHLRKQYGSLQLSDITPLMLETYVTQRAAIRKPKTVNHEIATVRHMFQKAIEWRKAIDNPVKHIKQLRVDNRRLRYLSLEEMQRLLEVADSVLHPILVAALHTGLRRGELFSLTWQDIDFKAGVIRVLHTKNGDSRDIPISPTLDETLRRIPRRLDSDYIFPGKAGNGIVDMRKRFKSTLRHAEIEEFVFHDLRHTFASHLVMAGVDLLTVKELLGHKRIEMTLRYAHLAPDHKRAAINRLDTYMDTRRNQGVAANATTP